METTDKTPATITLTKRMQIFGNYIGCEMDAWVVASWFRAKNLGIYNMDDPTVLFYTGDGQFKNLPVMRCKLIVKPISAISEEDAMAVAEIAYNGPVPNHSFSPTPKRIVSNIFENPYGSFGSYNTDKVITMIDFLRSRGYALPYGQYSVKQLVEENVFKLI